MFNKQINDDDDDDDDDDNDDDINNLTQHITWHFGQTNPLMFSTTPITRMPIRLQKLISLRTSNKETSCTNISLDCSLILLQAADLK